MNSARFNHNPEVSVEALSWGGGGSSGTGVEAVPGAGGHPPRSALVLCFARGNGLVSPQPQGRHGQQPHEDHQQEQRHPHRPAPRMLPTLPSRQCRPQEGSCRVEGANPAQLPHGPQGH